MTTTKAVLRQNVSKLDGSYTSGSTTTNIAANNSVTDTKLAGIGYHTANSLVDAWLWLSTTANADVERTISANTAAGTITIRGAALSAESGSQSFEVHTRFRPTKIIDALLYVFNTEMPNAHVQIRDTSIATRAGVYRYPVPATIIRSPSQILISTGSLSATDVDLCETAWTAGSNVTASLDNRDYQEGSGSCKLAVAAGASATAILGYDNFSALDLSDHIGLRFSIKSSVATTAGQLQVHLSETANGASATETLDVPALTAGEWRVCEVAYAAAPASRDAIISIAVYQVADIGVATVWIDGVRSITNNPADDINDMNAWSELKDWEYQPSDSKVYFRDTLPANHQLMFVGEGTLGSSLASESTTIALDEPEVEVITHATLLKLYTELFNAHGGRYNMNNPFASQVGMWEYKLREVRNRHGMVRPAPMMGAQQW